MTPSRFLFALWDGGGTAPPELAVVARLRSRGHHVTVLGDPSLSEDVARASARFIPWREAPHRTTRTRESEFVRDWEAWTPLGAFARSRDRHAFRPASLFAREVKACFERWPADVVVADAMLFGALAGAEATGAPVAALLPMTSFLPSQGRPPAGLGLFPRHDLFGRLRDRAIASAGERLVWRSCLPWLNVARREVGLGPLAHPLDQLRRVGRVLVQTSPWFDFDAPRSQGNVRYTGPELDDPAWATAAPQPLPPTWTRNSGEARVLVAFSTTFMGQAALLRRIIRALTPLPVRVLVTVGPALDPRAFVAPSHILVRAAASHREVLPQTSLVITHGGHGTVIRSLASGVPLLILPMGRDQSDNAARAEVLGAARRLSRRARSHDIRRAVIDALADPRLRAGADRARERLRAERTGDPAIEELEGLLPAARLRREVGTHA